MLKASKPELIEKHTRVERVEITRGGHIQVLMHKLLLEDGEVLKSDNHRTIIALINEEDRTPLPVETCLDLADKMLTNVNANLAQMKEAPVPTEDWDRVRRVVRTEAEARLGAAPAVQRNGPSLQEVPYGPLGFAPIHHAGQLLPVPERRRGGVVESLARQAIEPAPQLRSDEME